MVAISHYAAESDVTEKPIEPIKVYSEKELIREFEKIAATLVPEKDWTIRIAAMQRVEGLVLGGSPSFFSLYPSFPAKVLCYQIIVSLIYDILLNLLISYNQQNVQLND